MAKHRTRILKLLFGAATAGLLCAAAPAQQPEIVATVLDASITRSDLTAITDDRPRARKLLAVIWDHVAPHYVASRGLRATDAEIADLAAYDKRFETKDRSQRARKLEELDQRLRDEALDADERAYMQQFRATLQRLARYDAERDKEPPADAEQQATAYAAWIEMWKMNKAIYEEYGGVVARTRFGPDPHGARAALLRDYEAQGLLTIADAALRTEVRETLAAQPLDVIPPDRVDFTPYWKRPIPPSYFPN
ncbi:MAG TPA: hypothetical protein VD839_01610 [Burkholderiales bacterium]|nr:hypothetical protein [Burkholderiales bacterium]